MFRQSRLAVLLLLMLLYLVLSGCARTQVPLLQREQLFSLQYGKMEDQVPLYLDGSAVTRKTGLAMRGGLFYIASGTGSRIMEFTSYGDLLALHYNPAQNPRPVMLQSASDTGRASTRRAYQYPFNIVGEVAVTSRNTLLVEDRVPDRAAVFDEDLGVMLNRVVLRLDRTGQQIDYLGQEGVGGTFFPYIRSIDVTATDEIVVTTIAPPRSIVYWFDSDGSLLRRIEVTPETLPVPTEIAAAPLLESIRPDHELRRLYLKVNYYVRERHGPAQSVESVARLMSRIYWINIDDGMYEGFVDVPRNVGRDSLFGGLAAQEEFYYEFIGAASNEHLFLLSQESREQSQLLILHTSGKVVRRRTLDIDYNEIVIRDLHLSSNGILSALFATRDEVEIVWWRTDRLFDPRATP